MRAAVSVWLGLGLLSASLASVALGARVVLRDDPATVAFYKQVQASYRTVPAVRVRRHGFLWYSASVKGSLVRWVSAKQPPPGEGYKPATESLLVLLTKGRVTKYIDTAKAPGLPALTLIEGQSGLFVALSSKGTCYHAAARSGGVAGWGYICPSSRPTIRETTRSCVASARFSSPTLAPSRNTVTRSTMRSISSRR